MKFKVGDIVKIRKPKPDDQTTMYANSVYISTETEAGKQTWVSPPMDEFDNTLGMILRITSPTEIVIGGWRFHEAWLTPADFSTKVATNDEKNEDDYYIDSYGFKTSKKNWNKPLC